MPGNGVTMTEIGYHHPDSHCLRAGRRLGSHQDRGSVRRVTVRRTVVLEFRRGGREVVPGALVREVLSGLPHDAAPRRELLRWLSTAERHALSASAVDEFIQSLSAAVHEHPTPFGMVGHIRARVNERIVSDDEDAREELSAVVVLAMALQRLRSRQGLGDELAVVDE